MPDTLGIVIPIELSRIIIDEASDPQIIYLRETDGQQREFHIVIGIFEASALDRAVKGVRSRRPSTHELLGSVIREMGGRIERCEIHDIRGDTYFANLILSVESREITVDARPSDAITLAMSTGCPVFVAENVLNEASSRSE